MNLADMTYALALKKIADHRDRKDSNGMTALLGGLAGGAAGGLGGALYAGWAAKREVNKGMEGLKHLVGSKLKAFESMSLLQKLRYMMKKGETGAPKEKK